MKLVGAALGVHSDDAAGVATVIGRQNAALYAKLPNAVWGRNRAIHRIELGVLHLVAVDRDVGAIHLPARHRIGVSVIGDEVSCVP